MPNAIDNLRDVHARIVEITRADVPGLFDLLLEDGTRLFDLTVRQTQALVDRNGLVAVIEGRT